MLCNEEGILKENDKYCRAESQYYIKLTNIMCSTGYTAVCIIALVSCCLSEHEPLQLQKLSRDTTVGSYNCSTTAPTCNGKGIRFVSNSDGTLLIETHDGETLIRIEKPFNSENTRFIEINGDSFIQQQHESGKLIEYYIPTNEAHRIKRETASERDGITYARSGILHNVMSKAKKYDSKYHKAAENGAVRSLLHHSHLEHIIEGARYMGENMGFTGKEYPSLLQFYMIAMKLAKAKDQKINKYITSAESLPQCTKTCPPCPQNECLGMCGRNCDCWKWVCGNCCFNEGCYEHDLICIKCGGVSSLRCILTSIIGFSCGKHTGLLSGLTKAISC